MNLLILSCVFVFVYLCMNKVFIVLVEGIYEGVDYSEDGESFMEVIRSG